jgi:hypothetical protein
MRIYKNQKGEEVNRENYMKIFIICSIHLIILGWSSKRTRWAGHVASVRNIRNIGRISVGNLKEDKRFDGKTILKHMVRNIGCKDVDWLHQAGDII